jgi:MOSC domain-containing protein YiiM
MGYVCHMYDERIPLLSVNVGRPRSIGIVDGKEILSGIAKQPVTVGRVFVGVTNIEGDGQADLEVHGGLDKAVYAYPADQWPWWETEKGLACRPATFGENLTLTEVDETQVYIGDRFRWGGSLLEVSQPRAPCFKLAMHTRRPDAPQLITLSGFCGWYLRVLAEGYAATHDPLVRVAKANGPSVSTAFLTLFSPRPDIQALHQIHEAPALSAAWRRSVAKKIAAFGVGQ